MKENKGVGPNLKTYYYYTNEMAEREDAIGTVVIATGMEGTGALYDEIGEYLDSKGYALYAIDEWGYGKTGAVAKDVHKNWKKKCFYYASYNIHSLCVFAKNQHKDVPLYLLGNDFGAMLSLNVLKEFPDNIIDKVVTIGWGTPRGQDYGFLCASWLKKIFLYDSSVANLAHHSKNKRFAFRFGLREKFAWLTSDEEQLKKIKDAGYVDEPGTIGHYYYYFLNKIKVPYFFKSKAYKKMNKDISMLFVSGKDDLLTIHGRTTKALSRFYKRKGFANAETLILEGRHELLFEKNRLSCIDQIISWMNGEKIIEQKINKEENTSNTDAEIKDVVDEEVKVELVGYTTEINLNDIKEKMA